MRGGAASRPLVAVGAARERLALRRESAAALAASCAAALEQARALAARGGPSPVELEQAANEAATAARAAATERDDLAERARSARERLAALERSLAEREGIPPAARALAESGERLALAALDVEPGIERAVAAALGRRASAVLADDPRAALALLRRARDEGLGSLTVLAGREPRDLVAELPVVPLDELLDARRASVTTEGFGFDPASGELWFAARRPRRCCWRWTRGGGRSPTRPPSSTPARAAPVQAADEAAAARGRGRGGVCGRRASARAFPRRGLLGRLQAAAAGLDGLCARAERCAARTDALLAARAAAGASAPGALGDELRRLGALEARPGRRRPQAAARAQAAEVVVARLGGSPAAPLGDESADRARAAREAEELLRAAEAAATEAATRPTARAQPRRRSWRARRGGRPPIPTCSRGSSRAAEAVGDGLDREPAVAVRLEAPVRARADAGAQRASQLGAELRRLGAAEVELRQALDERPSAAPRSRSSSRGSTPRPRRRGAASRTRAPTQPAEGDDRDELAQPRRAARARAARRSAASTRSRRRSTRPRRSGSRSSRRSAPTSRRASPSSRSCATSSPRRSSGASPRRSTPWRRNFEEVAATLFPGGEGRLRLVEPDDEGEAEPGVEVELRPAGKKITRLSLLSGGEKALGAISFLFALFLAKPCPFYLLDEVEAALDDTNIGRFVELLRRYADRAQFVVITHQKRTMEAADVLYGVTMGGDGVSQIVSRRLPREDARVGRGIGVGSPRMSRTWAELLGDEAGPEDEPERTGFFSRLRDSLSKSRRALTAELLAAGFDPATRRRGSGSRRR